MEPDVILNDEEVIMKTARIKVRCQVVFIVCRYHLISYLSNNKISPYTITHWFVFISLTESLCIMQYKRCQVWVQLSDVASVVSSRRLLARAARAVL